MTDNEIIKALECCGEIDKSFCDGCCFFNETECVMALSKNALDLISCQKARIKELEERCNDK